MDTQPARLPPMQIRLNIASGVKIPLQESFLMLLARFEGSDDKWTVRVECPQPPDGDGAYLAWMQPLMPTFPVPQEGVPFELWFGVELLGSAVLCKQPTTFSREYLVESPTGKAMPKYVRVRLRGSITEGLWSSDAVTAMDGLVGTVDEGGVSDTSFLVHFAVPPRKWAMLSEDEECNSVLSYHFSDVELQAIDQQEFEEAAAKERSNKDGQRRAAPVVFDYEPPPIPCPSGRMR